MENITHMMAVLGLTDNSFTTIVVALIGLAGTGGVVGHKHLKEKQKPPAENSQVLFDQVNEFIKQQKEDRDDLRQEVIQLREELEELRDDNHQKELRINNLVRELGKEKMNSADLRKQIEELQASSTDNVLRNNHGLEDSKRAELTN